MAIPRFRDLKTGDEIHEHLEHLRTRREFRIRSSGPDTLKPDFPGMFFPLLFLLHRSDFRVFFFPCASSKKQGIFRLMPF